MKGLCLCLALLFPLGPAETRNSIQGQSRRM
jgi:hypothetical protein